MSYEYETPIPRDGYLGMGTYAHYVIKYRPFPECVKNIGSFRWGNYDISDH